MSNQDSFVDEVTEAVRRDRLYLAFRRYGWIGILAIIALVAFSGWTEWQQSQETARAQAYGDKMMDALALSQAETRRTALDEIPTETPAQKAVVALYKAAADAPKVVPEDVGAALKGVPGTEGLAPVYSDLAEFKLLVGDTAIPAADRRARFEALAVPGRPYRLLAQEQLALLDVQAGDSEAAIRTLNAIMVDNEVTPALRARSQQLIVALGGTPGS